MKKLPAQMHVSHNSTFEPRIMCNVTKKELIPDLDEVKNHVDSAQFKECLKEMHLQKRC
jgi:hypothetical protein